MANNLTTISKEGIEYLCGLIRELSNVSEGIDDINLRSNGTFSSVKIDTLLKTLKTDCNGYTDRLVANLSRLELKIVTNETDIIESNIMYLYKPDGATSYNQYVVIEGNKVLLGTTDISMTDYYTITQADAKFCLLTDYNSLKTTYEAHKGNTDIHVTKDKQDKWDKTSTDFTTHTGDTDIHITADERTAWNKVTDKIDKTSISTTIDSTSTDEQVASAKAVYTLDQNNFKMNASMLFNSDRDCTDGNLIIGQEYTASEPIIPHKMARLSIWWKTCHFSQATWLNDTWGYIDGYVNEFVSDTNHFHINTVRVLFRHADTKQFKVQYSKRVDFDLTSGTFTCIDLQGRCGFAIQIYK